ncbi:MAG: DUF2225 domain-containing protein [Candidatus Cohnella colombiensis]|uniref:DUF2225 domain-containing protein n=1 Tax=Candidatus Cohnella colombiensis TaxID=3121368 RepID=A0AA95EV22_9BACL|nr:MAG: DUF2225 domain-containing protein [Cohnella sp.]
MEPLYPIKVQCTCCEVEYQTSRVRPSFKKSINTDSDFCSYFKTVNPDYYVVRVCPNCGFASTESFDDRLQDRKKKLYLDKIGIHWKFRDYGQVRNNAEALECYKLALLTAQVVEEKDRVIAGILHHIVWLYRYDGNVEQEQRFLRYALDAYIRVFETERGSISNARLMYLIGELHRRLGEYHDAVKWFGRVINDRKIEDAAMIRASREQWQNIREDMTGRGEELPEEMQNSGA